MVEKLLLLDKFLDLSNKFEERIPIINIIIRISIVKIAPKFDATYG